VERWIQRSVLNLEHFIGTVLNRVRDRVAVRRSHYERLQNHQVERPLQKIYGRHDRMLP
jgi:hypothetical protein